FLAQGNAHIDALISASTSVLSDFQKAQESHQFLHQPAIALQKEFNISKQMASNIIAACPDCANVPALQIHGANPRGLTPREIFQTDVTIVPSFGKFKHVHVTVDTMSKLTWATPL
ncbi:POK25 protein, partial [Cochlearius cochlearius]|nr:POK25 protein [Cochlearius cochlearius]